MANLSVTYMGIELKNPVIIGASGLTSNLKLIKQIEEAGAGAIVCKSLFEEEIQLQSLQHRKNMHQYDEWHAEMTSVFPNLNDIGPEDHLYWVKKTKESINIPVIASINAVNEETWLNYSGLLEETGVDGIELNLYSSPEFHLKTSDNIEQRQIELLKKIRDRIKIPISVKLSPYYTNIAKFITQLDKMGINGFVLFNRAFQTNIDIDRENMTFPFTFSHKEDNLLSLKMAGLLYKTIDHSICCSTGIMDSEDIIKMLLAGADAVQIVSTVIHNGIPFIAEILEKMDNWMDNKEYHKISDFKGKLSRINLAQKDRWIYKRTQYIKILMQTSKSISESIY